jgi:crotonobetainyl-CoA:carnitine CoA-transferase CaiB-like acyl-CoA transferase
MTGYGQDGPYSNLAGHDLNCIALGGALDLIGGKDKKPVIPLNLIADIGGGAMFAAVGILAALIARQSTGRGQHIDISLTDSVVSLLTTRAADYFEHGVVPGRGETTLGGAYPYYNVYEAADGKFVSLGCIEPWLWEEFCREIGREDFIPFHFQLEHMYHPAEDKEWENITSFLRQLFKTRGSDEWFELLSQKDIPVSRVHALSEVFLDAQVLHRQMVTELEDPVEGRIKQTGIAIKLSDTPGRIRSLPPTPGEHTEEILTEIGYSQQNIAELRQETVIG